jgi:hypothetical protein
MHKKFKLFIFLETVHLKINFAVDNSGDLTMCVCMYSWKRFKLYFCRADFLQLLLRKAVICDVHIGLLGNRTDRLIHVCKRFMNQCSTYLRNTNYPLPVNLRSGRGCNHKKNISVEHHMRCLGARLPRKKLMTTKAQDQRGIQTDSSPRHIVR